jgi:hypothetical protein
MFLNLFSFNSLIAGHLKREHHSTMDTKREKEIKMTRVYIFQLYPKYISVISNVWLFHSASETALFWFENLVFSLFKRCVFPHTKTESKGNIFIIKFNFSFLVQVHLKAQRNLDICPLLSRQTSDIPIFRIRLHRKEIKLATINSMTSKEFHNGAIDSRIMFKCRNFSHRMNSLDDTLNIPARSQVMFIQTSSNSNYQTIFHFLPYLELNFIKRFLILFSLRNSHIQKQIFLSCCATQTFRINQFFDYLRRFCFISNGAQWVSDTAFVINVNSHQISKYKKPSFATVLQRALLYTYITTSFG